MKKYYEKYYEILKNHFFKFCKIKKSKKKNFKKKKIFKKKF